MSETKTDDPYWSYDDEEMYLDTDPEVLSDPEIQELLKKICELQVPDDRPKWFLNQKGWEFGFKIHEDRAYADSILERNANGWVPTNAKAMLCKGTKTNYKAKIKNVREGLRLLLGRIEKGYIWGPFRDPEVLPPLLDDPVTWPQFYKEEHTQSKLKTRVLTNFTDDTLGLSFNDYITEEEKSCTYVTITHIIWLILIEKLKWIWAIDAYEAYYRVPIRSDFIRFMGFRLCGLLFFFTCLVMGMASACKLYTEFADAVCWIIINNEPDLFIQFTNGFNSDNGVNYLLLHYIDDFFGGAHSLKKAIAQFNAVRKWWIILGIPAQARKCTAPTQILVYVGYVFNLITYTLGIPELRLLRYLDTAAAVRNLYENGHRVRVRKLQQLVGQFRSLQVVYPYIVPFLRSWEFITSRFNQNEMIYITAKMIRDLEVVECAIMDIKENPMPFSWIIYPKNSADIHVYTDAATNFGVGGFIEAYKGKHFATMWSDTVCIDEKYKPDIVFMELLGVVAAMQLYAEAFAGKAISFHCDNIAVVAMVIKKCACFRRPDLNDLLAIMAKIAMKHRLYI